MSKDQSKPYLIFSLGEEKFAINIDSVQEVVELDMVTKIPNAPVYMLGIINLRGRVLPLLDTRIKLSLPKSEITKKSRILVIELPNSDNTGTAEVGALVDVAREVVELNDSQIQKAPEMESGGNISAITGIVNNNGDITMIMDIQRVFALSEILQLNAI